MAIDARTRTLIIATFVALTAGFGAGYWIGSQSSGSADELATGGNAEDAPHPVGAQEYAQLAMSSLGQGEYQEAERLFRKASEMQPDNAELHADLAVSLMYQERWDEAHGEIQQAKQIDPEMPEVYFLQGVIYRDARQDTAKAREAWTHFLTLVPDDSPQAQTVRGWLDELSGKAPADTAGVGSMPNPHEQPPTTPEGR